MLNPGTISNQEYMTFHSTEHTFFQDAFQCIKKKFPLDDQLVCNSVWLNFTKCSEANCTNVPYFYDRHYDVSSFNITNLKFYICL